VIRKLLDHPHIGTLISHCLSCERFRQILNLKTVFPLLRFLFLFALLFRIRTLQIKHKRWIVLRNYAGKCGGSTTHVPEYAESLWYRPSSSHVHLTYAMSAALLTCVKTKLTCTNTGRGSPSIFVSDIMFHCSCEHTRARAHAIDAVAMGWRCLIRQFARIIKYELSRGVGISMR